MDSLEGANAKKYRYWLYHVDHYLIWEINQFIIESRYAYPFGV